MSEHLYRKLDKLITLSERIVELLESKGVKTPSIYAPSHLWLTYGEVVALGITGRTVTNKIRSGVWEARNTGKNGRNGKPIWEIKFTSLPEELQKRWMKDKEFVKTV